MAEFERIVLDKLEEIKSMIVNIPREDIIDIRQSYKTLVYSVNTIVQEYERRCNKIDNEFPVGNEKQNVTISFSKDNSDIIGGYIVKGIKGAFDVNAFGKHLVDEVLEKVKYIQKDVLTSDETAKYLGVSKSSLYKWTMSRQIPHYKSPTGKMCFFNRKEIEAWMQRNRVATDDELEQQAQAIVRKK